MLIVLIACITTIASMPQFSNAIGNWLGGFGDGKWPDDGIKGGYWENPIDNPENNEKIVTPTERSKSGRWFG